MQLSKYFGLGFVVVSLMVISLIQSGNCQSGFSGSRPSTNVIFEPTISFIRQNMRLMQSYISLFRSIFVGAYDRPLITSTDGPGNSANTPAPASVPPMDLPSRRVSNSRRP